MLNEMKRMNNNQLFISAEKLRKITGFSRDNVKDILNKCTPVRVGSRYKYYLGDIVRVIKGGF